ncbi:putative toxin-antitoxin system toxin component, PIN family [Parapedobacter sp. 10938]|uniref:putative toxin-antitoxin system toxin component, PIN family n=1 Tax=Parapedobacter flavus TaxID=3110225 RepID=UPI002DBC3CAD|nr:putative toxin-antitoxin system toxin component, PIN family [Parapedobacter sp. 10938]MEC3881143.1 putative toxin-antitoxin system toxin component, PIN family [Parapedobacter sp. 10938]
MKNNIFLFDVNTLVSAFLIGSHTNNRAFREALIIGKAVCTYDIKRELSDVFLREKFDRYASLNERISILSFLETQLIELPKPNLTIKECRDPKDNQYLELAVSVAASCIITGDKDLLILNPFENIPILNAADFLKVFA